MNQKQAQQSAKNRVDKAVAKRLKEIIQKLAITGRVALTENAKLYGKLSDVIAFNAQNPDNPKNLRAEAERRGILRTAQKRIAKSWRENNVNTDVANTSKESYVKQYYLFMYSTLFFAGRNFVAPPDNGKLTVSVYGQLDVPQVNRAIKGRSQQQFQKYISRNGLKLSDTLRSFNLQELDKITQAIENGLSSGQSQQKTARLLRDKLTSSYNRMIRIVRTESHRVRQLSEYEVFDNASNKGIELERILEAVLDGRERDQSADMNGQIADEEKGGFFYPAPVSGYVLTPGNSGYAGFDINDRESVFLRQTQIPQSTVTGVNPVTGERETMTYRDYPQWLQDTTKEYRQFNNLATK